jgi:hypothetical protein
MWMAWFLGQMTRVLMINISLTPVQRTADDVMTLRFRPMYTNDQYSRGIMNNIVRPANRSRKPAVPFWTISTYVSHPLLCYAVVPMFKYQIQNSRSAAARCHVLRH